MNYRNLKIVLCLPLSFLILMNLWANNPPFVTQSNGFDSEYSQNAIALNGGSQVCPPITSVACVPAFIGYCGESSSPNVTGWPTVDGNEVAPTYMCYQATYTDTDLGGCGNSYIVNRVWKVKNTNTNQTVTCIQNISLTDDEAPELTCPNDIEVSCETDPSEFSGPPAVFDACGSSYTQSYTDSPYQACTGSGYSIIRTWHVTDACGNQSSCAMEIDILCRPTQQASHIVFSGISSNQLTLSWFVGNGSKRIVVINTTNNFTLPVDGYDPFPVSSTYSGNGQQVVYNEDGNTVTVNGLSSNITYWFRVFEYSDCSGSNYFLTTTATGNPKSQKTLSGCEPIVIANHPSPQFPIIPNPATFTVAVTGSSPVYQWQALPPCSLTWQNLTNGNNTTWTTGGNFSTLTILNTAGLAGYTYHAVISNDCSSIISGPGEIISASGTYSVQTKTPYNIANFPNPYTIASSSMSQTPPTIKICADGSKATIVNYTNIDPTINPSNIRFLIESDPAGTNSDLTGYFVLTDYSISGFTVTAKFTHPKYLPAEYLPYRSDRIIVVDQNNPNCYLFIIPIQIYRAPILFVHGFYGNASTFSPMANYFKTNNYYTPPLLNIINYHSTSLEAFASNVDEIPKGIYNSYYKTLSAKYSCGQLDIISHSMGGILSRLYLQDNYGYVYKNEINKLITINTPHSGSYLADALHTIAFIYCEVSNLMNINSLVCNGAGEDMRTSSYATDEILNSSYSLSNNHVPSHTITTTLEPIPISLYAPAPFFIFIPLVILEYNALLNGLPSDGVVSINSQVAGLNGNQTSNPSAHFHVGSSAQFNVWDDVKDLLCSNPTSNKFTLDGFSPPNLFAKKEIYNKVTSNIVATRNLLVDNYMKILSPTNSNSFLSDETITIEISSGASIKRCIVLGGNKSLELNYFDTIISSELTFISHSIPHEAIGKYEIDVIGLDSLDRYVASDSVSFYVNTIAALDSIRLDPNVILVPTNLLSNFQLMGYFSDGGSRDITEMPLVEYTVIKSEVAKVIIPGLIEGSTIDSTQLIASFQGFSDSIPLYVYDGDSLRHALFTSKNNVICEGGNVELSNLSSGHPLGIQWLFPGGEPSNSTDENPLISYSNSGKYDVSLIATYDNMIDTLLLPGFISVNSNPNVGISASGPTSLCQGQSVELSAEIGEEYNYLWSNGDTSQSVTVFDSGFYFVTIWDRLGCSATSDIEHVMFYVNPMPDIDGLSTLCTGDSIEISVVGLYDSYSWSNGEGTQSILITEPGQYSVIVIDSNGCTSPSSGVFIEELPSPTPVVFHAGPTEFCLGDSLWLSTGLASSYLWSTGDTTQFSSVKTSGIFSITVSDTNGCTGVSIPLSITVYDLPLVDLGPDTITIELDTILDAGNPGASFLWNTGDTTQTIFVNSPGIYTVNVTDLNNCVASASIYIDIRTDVIVIDNAEQIKIFPNPNNGSFTLSGELPVSEMLQIKLINSVGHIVFTSDAEEVSGRFNKTIDLNEPIPGVYYLILHIGARSYSGKVLIQPY